MKTKAETIARLKRMLARAKYGKAPSSTIRAIERRLVEVRGS